MTLSARFIGSVGANIAYWQERTRDPEDEDWNILAKERQNLIRAVQYGQAIEETWLDAAKLLLQCYDLIERQGVGGPWIGLFTSMVDRCPDDRLELKCELMNRLGTCYRHERQLDTALEIHKSEYRLVQNLGNQLRLAHAQVSLSLVYYLQHNYQEAERYGHKAMIAFEELHAEPNKQGVAVSILGLVAQGRGELALAVKRLGQAADLFRQAGHTVNLARMLRNMAYALEAAGKTDEALTAYREAVTLLDQTDFELEKCITQISLGVLYFNQGEYDKAEAAWLLADSPYLRRSGQPYWQANVISNLANIFMVQDKLERAERWFRRSIELWRAADAHLMLANTLGDLAKTLVARSDRDSAIPLYEEAISICRAYPEDAWGKSMAEKFEAAMIELNGE